MPAIHLGGQNAADVVISLITTPRVTLSAQMQVEITEALDMDEVRTLWKEYWADLGFAPDFQSFNQELRSLPGKYAPPNGKLLIAKVAGDTAGCVALRPLSTQGCEAKRLYVRTVAAALRER